MRASWALVFCLMAGEVAAEENPGDARALDLPPVTVFSSAIGESSSPAISRVDFADEPLVFQTPAGLSDRTANLYISTSDARSFNDTVALRGMTNTPIFGPPAVSFYLDDLPLGSSFTLPTDLVGFAHAELHRGPTHNTGFGRAGPAGVLVFATPPLSSHASGEARGSLGSYDARAITVQQQSAAGGRADAYVSAAYSARDGYVENTRLGRDVDFKELVSALARIRFYPTEPLALGLLITAQQAEDGAQPLVPLGGPLFTLTRASEGETNLEAVNVALTAAATTDAGRLSAVTSFTDWDLSPYSSVLAFGPQELTNDVAQAQHTWSEELKWVADPNAAFRWQIGGFFSTGSTDGAFTRRFDALTFEQSAFELENHDVAGFGEATFALSEKLTLTPGLRWEVARREIDRREAVPTVQRLTRDHESSAVLPKVELNYAVAPHTAVFAALGTGYKPGGFSAFTGNPALTEFGPERTRAAEAAITQSNAMQTKSATVRVFYYDITGYQIERSFATSAVADDYLVVNADRARSWGGEVEVLWKLIHALTASMSVGVTRVELREFRDPFTAVSYEGKRAPYVPAYDGSVRLAYAPARGWFGDVELTANGLTFYTENEDAGFSQKAYALLRARVGFGTGRYRVAVFGDNLTDKRYYRAISPGTFHGTPGAPRTMGVEAAVTW